MPRSHRRLDHDQAVVGRARLLAVVLAAGALIVATPAAGARPRVVSLPWPPTVLPKTPPLAPPTTGVLPLPAQFSRRLRNRERIVVGLDEEGAPHSIRVLQTILVERLGDYVFAIPAPVRSVSPGPGTESPPGQRENQILWEGFSPGRRLLAAWADLRVAESAGSLPVRVRVQTEVDGRALAPGERRSGDLRVSLTITNATAVTARSFTAEPEPVSLGQVLGRIRDAIRRDVFAEGLNIGLLSPPTAVETRVAAPLRVDGELRFAPGTARIAGAEDGVVPVTGLLDGVRRSRLRLVLRGRAHDASAPRLELRVRTARIEEPSAPPRSRRELLARTIALELTYARRRQFDMFIAGPDQTGPSSATYVFRTALGARAAPPAAGTDGGGDHTVGWIVLALGLAAAVPAAAVIWAHS